MFEKVKEIIASKKRFVLVTHINADGDGLGAQFALGRFLRRHGKDVRVINGLIGEVDGDIDAAEAEPIYVSIVTDTGNFRFSNTTPQVLTTAADLLSKGVKVPLVYQEIFERYAPSFVKLLGTALSSIQQDETGRLGYIRMTREMMRACGADGED